MERCFRFVPLDTRIFDPEVGILTLTPIGHPIGVEQLESKSESAYPAVFGEVPDQLVLHGIWITALQWTRRIVRKWYCGLLHHLDRSVTKRHVAPIAQLLIRFDFLAGLE